MRHVAQQPSTHRDELVKRWEELHKEWEAAFLAVDLAAIARIKAELRTVRRSMLRPRRRRRTYSWALRVPPGGQGREWARDLAENARERAQGGVGGKWIPPRLTQADIAARDGVSRKEVSQAIEAARHSLFGDVSDSTVYRRLRRRDELKRAERRECAAPDCSELLPPDSRRSRQFHHPRCRVRMHQQKQRGVI